MEKIKKTIEELLGSHICSLQVSNVMGDAIIYLTYQDSLPISEVMEEIQKKHKGVIFDEIVRVYSEGIIQKVYSRLYDDSEYDRYWEEPEVGERIDHWLEGMRIV